MSGWGQDTNCSNSLVIRSRFSQLRLLTLLALPCITLNTRITHTKTRSLKFSFFWPLSWLRPPLALSLLILRYLNACASFTLLHLYIKLFCQFVQNIFDALLGVTVAVSRALDFADCTALSERNVDMSVRLVFPTGPSVSALSSCRCTSARKTTDCLTVARLRSVSRFSILFIPTELGWLVELQKSGRGTIFSFLFFFLVSFDRKLSIWGVTLGGDEHSLQTKQKYDRFLTKKTSLIPRMLFQS